MSAPRAIAWPSDWPELVRGERGHLRRLWAQGGDELWIYPPAVTVVRRGPKLTVYGQGNALPTGRMSLVQLRHMIEPDIVLGDIDQVLWLLGLAPDVAEP